MDYIETIRHVFFDIFHDFVKHLPWKALSNTFKLEMNINMQPNQFPISHIMIIENVIWKLEESGSTSLKGHPKLHGVVLG